jgi:hypothetical protein
VNTLATGSGGSVPFLSAIIIPLAVAFVGILGGIVLASLSRRQEARAHRQEFYAEAVKAVVEWMEYPYRIRRRTSDDSGELRRLTEIGHGIQERLAYYRTWTLIDNAETGAVYGSVIEGIRQRLGSACRDAWTMDPISSPEGMNLQSWGPGSMRPELELLEQAIGRRFSLRRFHRPRLRKSHLHETKGQLSGVQSSLAQEEPDIT